MTTKQPMSAEEIRALLLQLNVRQLDRLAELSAVPRRTLYKIRVGDTANPGVETVRKFLPFIQEAKRKPPRPDATPPPLEAESEAERSASA